jgi:hypothetical protein
MRVIAPLMPYHAETLDSTHPSPNPNRQLHRQRDRLDHCTALAARRPRLPRSSVPPATRPASAPRAAVIPHYRRCLHRLLIRHHLLCLPLDASGWAHPQHDTDVSGTCGSRSPPRTPHPGHPQCRPTPCS